MCRTSAFHAGLLLRRPCRREKAHVSSVDIARFPGKRGMPFLCCPEFMNASSVAGLVSSVHFCSFTRYPVVYRIIRPRTRTKRAGKSISLHNVLKTDGGVVGLR